ncbi:hypothetical protein C1925_09435 [Stenotrophomonas sp. SAU14A_NAIMI4_5]|uniref:hypothetical protein n=1 Tax=Stenotrophomonas sp. SAU14A_NAIMI4_5 TaxID=2072413 RepID=UPI000D53DE8F|nr:hypothetical protein [Stenotrophomonas sp. SAU14A_NAIMI4_5]AWH49357.1 hypothetical protein C1925_09435 [Stenotrophomonas sp. SAU14A_NAIMI4_5]
MCDLPIADAIFSAILNNDMAAIGAIEERRSGECAYIRTVLCTDAPGAVDLDLGLGASSSQYVTPFFKGPRALFLSAGTAIDARLNGGSSSVQIDFSLSFDSNFAEKLRAVVAGENIQQVERDRVVEILMLKAQNNRVQFDVMPFLIENTRLVREDPSNGRPLNTLIAFRMLDHLDWDALRRDASQLVFDTPPQNLRDRLRSEADAFLLELQSSEEIARLEANSIRTRALLLRFARLWHGPGTRDKGRILGELLHFCIDTLGSISLTELHLIWSGMITNQGSPFFGPIIGKSAGMLQKIRGMAWDMTLLRAMEKTATKNEGDTFFIPYFVSLDRRWRDLLRLTPVSMMVMDDENRRVLFARIDELDFQRALGNCAPAALQSEMAPEKVEARRTSARNVDLGTVQRLAEEEERHCVALGLT